MSKRAIVIRLVVESEDGDAAFNYLEDSVDELLDAGTIQDAICEHLGDRHPVNVEIVDSSCHQALDVELDAHPERETDYSRLIEMFARVAGGTKTDGLTMHAPGRALQFHFDPHGVLLDVSTRVDAVPPDVVDGLEHAPREELLRQLRALRVAFLESGRRMGAKVDERQACIEVLGRVIGEVIPDARATGTALEHAEGIARQLRAHAKSPPTVAELRRRGVRLHDFGPSSEPRPLVALTEGDIDGDGRARAYAVLDPAPLVLEHVVYDGVEPLTAPQGDLLLRAVDAPVVPARGRLRGPFMRTANALVARGLARFGDEKPDALLHATEAGRALAEGMR